MKTTLKRTVNLALIVALLCPLNIAMAQKSFSFSGSNFKGGKTAVSKSSVKKSSPSRVGSKPIRYTPSNKSKAVSKTPSRVNFKPSARPYTPSKVPNKNLGPYPIGKQGTKPFPKPITRPYPKPNTKPFPKPFTMPIPNLFTKPFPYPITKPLPKPIDITGDKSPVNPNPRDVREERRRLEERLRRAAEERRRRDAEERRQDEQQGNNGGANNGAPEDNGAPQDNGGANNGAPQDNGGNAGNANCPHHCHGHCNHNGLGFGLDFPRWGFSYGPNGIFIRGGGRFYDTVRPGVVIVDQPVVVEEAAPIVEEDVAIREVANLPEVYVASTISLASKTSLGNETGQVILDINGVALPTAVRNWTAESTTCTLPMIGLDQPKEARLVMLTADGQVAHSISVLLLPAKAPEVAPME